MHLLDKLKHHNIIKPDNTINSNTVKMLMGNYSHLYDELVATTSFISLDRPHALLEKINAIVNNISHIPKCSTCNGPTSYNRQKRSYNDFCSDRKCFSNERLKRSQQTMLEKYGVKHAFQNDISLTQFKNTMKERYGVEYTNQNDVLKKKMQTTMLEKYGVSARTHINLNKYVLELINDSTFLYHQHHELKKPLIEIAKDLNVSESLISSRCKKHDIEVINYYSSNDEQEISSYISSYANVINRSRSIIPPYELDIYIPSHNLAVEYCGLYWHCELHKEINYHKTKYDMCKERGIRLITIFEDEWIYNKELIKTKLMHILGNSTNDKIHARKCKVGEVLTEDKTNFLNQYHIQGNGPSSINLGLYYNEELVACLGFIKEQNNVYNLSRYATSKNVVGGFSKLLSHFEKIYKPSQIYTFADLRWSEGDLYYKSGFQLDKILPPDYSYVTNDKRKHKFNFRHINLAKVLGDKYNNKLTEHKNCYNNKIYRIYDCGKLRFIKNANC